jgi:hypothetical protein
MLWIPTNKQTQIEYPAITDEEKNEYMKDELYMSKYTLAPMPGSDKPKAPDPIEAKKSDQIKPKEEKE